MEIGRITGAMQTQVKPIELAPQVPQTSQVTSKQAPESITMHHLADHQSTSNEEEGQAHQTLNEEKVMKAIEDANKKMDMGDHEFEFSVHEKTKQIMVKVVDANTKEVVRELPPEKIVDMVAAMCEDAGLFVDEKR